MSTDDTENAMYLATLVRGEVHYLREIRFEHGISTVIEAHHKKHLEEHAVDVVNAPGFDPEYDEPADKIQIKAKFTFEPYDGPLEVGETIGVSAAAREGDPDAAERLRAFAAKEAARLARPPRDVPKFDPEARQEVPLETEAEVTEMPRARPPKPSRRPCLSPPWRP